MDNKDKIKALKERLFTADAILIGAGAGLSTAAGYVYTGERLEKYFGDLKQKYGIEDMYSAGFYPYPTKEDFWGFWCRHIWLNRYAPIPTDLYDRLFSIVKDKDYFVLTTNVDHCFQRSGFDKKRLFYMQGDMGLFQSSRPHGITAHKTYDNYEVIRKMVLSEGYLISENGELMIPDRKDIRTSVLSELVPFCPDDGEPMTFNLRIDDSFVQDAGWYAARDRYSAFLRNHESRHVLYLELGVGANTPGIIKYPFWRFTAQNQNSFYACINLGEAWCPDEISGRSICIDAGLGETIRQLQ